MTTWIAIFAYTCINWIITKYIEISVSLRLNNRQNSHWLLSSLKKKTNRTLTNFIRHFSVKNKYPSFTARNHACTVSWIALYLRSATYFYTFMVYSLQALFGKAHKLKVCKYCFFNHGWGTVDKVLCKIAKNSVHINKSYDFKHWMLVSQLGNIILLLRLSS